MNAAIETRLPDGPSSRHGPRAVAFSFGLTARGACLLLAHSFCVPTWYDLACLAHAVHFPVQARLMVNWQHGGSSEYIPSLMKQFPFLNQPIEAVAPSNIAAPPTGMGRLSRELRGMLSERLQLLSLPKIRYAFSDTSPPFLATRREGDAGVSVVPEGWKPGTEGMI